MGALILGIGLQYVQVYWAYKCSGSNCAFSKTEPKPKLLLGWECAGFRVETSAYAGGHPISSYSSPLDHDIRGVKPRREHEHLKPEEPRLNRKSPHLNQVSLYAPSPEARHVGSTVHMIELSS